MSRPVLGREPLAVGAGEVDRITRDGLPIAELRGLPHRGVTSQLVERHRRLPRIDAQLMWDESRRARGGRGAGHRA